MFSVMGTQRSAFFKKNRAGALLYFYHAIS